MIFIKKTTISAILFLSLAVLVYAAATQSSPSTCSGAWTACSNAFSDNVNSATAAVSSANKSGVWTNYNNTLPADATINNVVARADFFATKTNGKIEVRASGDSGASWGPSHAVGGNTAEIAFNITLTNDTSWTPTKLNSTNFKLNVTCFKEGSGANPTCNLYWLPVNVTYTVFDFNTAVSPTSGTVTQGDNTSTTVTVTLLSGTPQTVTLSVNGRPSGTNCVLNQTTGNPTFNSLLSITTTSSTPTGNHSIVVSGTNGSLVRNAVYTLTVNAAPCTQANPLVSTTPSTQNGTNGTQLSYTTTVTNQDSTSCAAATFDMTSSIPSGWSASYNESSFALSSGAQKFVLFSITSAANATSDDYVFTNTATNHNASSFTASANATYHVV